MFLSLFIYLLIIFPFIAANFDPPTNCNLHKGVYTSEIIIGTVVI